MDKTDTKPTNQNSRNEHLRKGNFIFSLIQSAIALSSPLLGLVKDPTYPYTTRNPIGNTFFPLIQSTNLAISLISIIKMSKEKKIHRNFRLIFLITSIFISIIAFVAIQLVRIKKYVEPDYSGDPPPPAYGVYSRSENS